MTAEEIVSSKNRLQELAEEVSKLQKKFQDQGKEILSEAFKEFFTKYPVVEAIAWTQYAPYFNDGDRCVFSVHELCATLDKSHPDYASLCALNPGKLDEGDTEEDEDEEEDDDDCGEYSHYECQLSELFSNADTEFNRNCKWKDKDKLVPITAEQRALYEDYLTLCNSCNAIENVFEMVFGDDVKVVATKNGFHTSEYDHD